MYHNADPKPAHRPKKKPTPLKRTPVAKKSKKQSREDGKYSRRAKIWLIDRFCPCCAGPAEQVHHKMGRKGYADQWALDRRILLLHDERYWLATCYTLHEKIEKNPEWARQNGYSISRSNIISK